MLASHDPVRERRASSVPLLGRGARHAGGAVASRTIRHPCRRHPDCTVHGDILAAAGAAFETDRDDTTAPAWHWCDRVGSHSSLLCMMPPTNSHECHGDPIGGPSRDGKILMTEFTRPGQVPYRCLQSRSMSCISIRTWR